jgi:ornithine--oxo-acid transaminase
MAEMETLDLAGQSAAKGAFLLEELKKLDSPAVEDLRGRGLLVGLEVREGIDTKRLASAFLEEGILTKETRSRTFRFAPPLTISQDDLAEIVRRTGRALSAVAPVGV